MYDPYVERLKELYDKTSQKLAALQYVCIGQAEDIRQLKIKLQEKTDAKVDGVTAVDYFALARDLVGGCNNHKPDSISVGFVHETDI